MTDSQTTNVSLGNRTIKIQNSNYNDPDGIQNNPYDALAQVGAVGAATAVYGGFLGALGAVCIGGASGGIIGVGLALAAIKATAFEGVDMKGFYDSVRFTGDVMKSYVSSVEADTQEVNMSNEDTEPVLESSGDVVPQHDIIN